MFDLLKCNGYVQFFSGSVLGQGNLFPYCSESSPKKFKRFSTNTLEKYLTFSFFPENS